MIRFNSLSEAEKFVITKEMINARDLVLVLRPELSEKERELVVTRNLSKKLGGGVDASLIGRCNAFAIEKTGIEGYNKFDFDAAKEDYELKVESDNAEKTNVLKKAKKETNKIQNKLIEKQNLAKNAKSKKKGAKFMLWSSVAMIGLTTFGNFSAIIGGVTSFLLGLPAVGFAVFALSAYFGLKIIQNFIWPKIKGTYKGSIEALTNLSNEAEKAQEGIQTELNNAKTAEIAAEQEAADYKNIFTNEKDVLDNKYKTTTDIDNNLTLALGELTLEEQKKHKHIDGIEETDDQKEKHRQNISEIKKYYTSLMFKGVNSGEILNDEELKGTIEKAKAHMSEALAEEFALGGPLNTEQRQEIQDILIAEGVN